MGKTLIRKSERIYEFLLAFYPKSYRQEFGEEMRYVFSQSIKDAYEEKGGQGIINHWGRTIIDVGKSLVVQHVENGGEIMKTKNKDIFTQKRVFLWVGVVTALILMIPFLAMQFHVILPDPGSTPGEVNWSLFDFLVMGILIFGTGSLYVITVRKMPNMNKRVIVGVAFLIALFLMWAELAVGIFGTPFGGS